MFERALAPLACVRDAEKTALRLTSSKIGRRYGAPMGFNRVPINHLDRGTWKLQRSREAKSRAIPANDSPLARLAREYPYSLSFAGLVEAR